MPDPYIGEELSDSSIKNAMEQFVRNFSKRYSTSGPILCMGSLYEALVHSLFDPVKVSFILLYTKMISTTDIIFLLAMSADTFYLS